MSINYARQHFNDPEAELASRELARRSLLDFTTYTYPQYNPEFFHEDMALHLEEVVKGNLNRLIIIAPPQHGKSEMVSVRLPAYFIGKVHEMPVLICSYGATLAWEKAAAARNIIYSDAFRALFPERLKKGSKRIPWMLKDYNTKLMASGVRGPITGRGVGLGIIDDPFKSWEDAYSINIRNKTWEWWKGTFRTRIWAEGRIVIIMTRWHEDDLAGRILNTSGEKWTVLRYPALAETQEERDAYNIKYLSKQPGSLDPLGRNPGEPLCPMRFPIHALLDIKHDVGMRAWQAEYQGTPKPLDGNRVKNEWIKIVEDYPKSEIRRYVRYWDKAGTTEGGAYTTGVLFAWVKSGIFYVIDIVRGQWSALEREAIIKNTAIKDLDTYGTVEHWIEQEPGSGGKESAQRTILNLAGFLVHADRPYKAKEIRFEPFAIQMEAGNVFILRRPWTWGYIDELLMFPYGTYKDLCDASSGAFGVLTRGGWAKGVAE